MKRKLLAWLLLMILSSLAVTNSSFQLEHRQGDVNLSRLQGQKTIHVEGVLGTVRLNRTEEDHGSGSSKEQGDLLVASDNKGQKGKTGINGGGNLSHRPKTNATPRPSLIAKTMLHVSFSLALTIHSFKLL